MNLINPTTGSAFGHEQRLTAAAEQTNTMNQIIAGLRHMDVRLDELGRQQFQFGLFLEFFSTRLLELSDDEGEPIFDLGMDEFPDWAQTRVAEMRAEAEATQAAAEEQAAVPAIGELNLNDE